MGPEFRDFKRKDWFVSVKNILLSEDNLKERLRLQEILANQEDRARWDESVKNLEMKC